MALFIFIVIYAIMMSGCTTVGNTVRIFSIENKLQLDNKVESEKTTTREG